MTSKNNGQPKTEKKTPQPNAGKASLQSQSPVTKNEEAKSEIKDSATDSTTQNKSKAKAAPKGIAAKETKAASAEKTNTTEASKASAAKDKAKPASDKPKQRLEEQVKAEDKRAKKAVRLATLAIVLAAVFSGGAAFIFIQKSAQLEAQVSQLKAQTDQMKSLTEQMKAEQEQRLASAEETLTNKANEAYNKTETAILQQSESIKSLQVALAAVKGRSSNDWLLAEADYLVKLAGRKLLLEKDVVTATHLMENADQRISAMNDPGLTSLRRQMTQDIATLRSVALVDKDGLVLKLAVLQQQVNTMPLANAILPEAPVAESREVSTDINDWQDNLLTSVKDFSEHFVTFRTREGNVIPLLSPQQHYYLRENIKGKIETAIRAVYNENQALYQSSMQTANEWAKQFFRLDDPAVVQFEATMQQLSTLNVEVKYPVKLVSQQPLSDLINERLRRQVTSMTVEEQQ